MDGCQPDLHARNKDGLGFRGNGVVEIFKNFQFDIGAPHHYLDFRYEVVDHDLGYFWLAHCGAYKYVRLATNDDSQSIHNMCHDMEDRTFDATLAVNNPGARAKPDSPAPSARRGPEWCPLPWEVRITSEASPCPDHPMLSSWRPPGRLTSDSS